MLNIILTIIILSFVNSSQANQSYDYSDVNTGGSKTIINNQSSATANSQNGGNASATSNSSVTVNGDNVTGIISTEVNGDKQELKINNQGSYSIRNNNGQVTITNEPKDSIPSPTIKQSNQPNNQTNNQPTGIFSWIKKFMNFISRLID